MIECASLVWRVTEGYKREKLCDIHVKFLAFCQNYVISHKREQHALQVKVKGTYSACLVKA